MAKGSKQQMFGHLYGLTKRKARGGLSDRDTEKEKEIKE